MVILNLCHVSLYVGTQNRYALPVSQVSFTGCGFSPLFFLFLPFCNSCFILFLCRFGLLCHHHRGQESHRRFEQCDLSCDLSGYLSLLSSGEKTKHTALTLLHGSFVRNLSVQPVQAWGHCFACAHCFIGFTYKITICSYLVSASLIKNKQERTTQKEETQICLFNRPRLMKLYPEIKIVVTNLYAFSIFLLNDGLISQASDRMQRT